MAVLVSSNPLDLVNTLLALSGRILYPTLPKVGTAAGVSKRAISSYVDRVFSWFKSAMYGSVHLFNTLPHSSEAVPILV